MKNLSSHDKLANRKIVHSFCYDETLRRAYNNPLKYLSKTSGYLAASSFDFTMDEKMDFAQILNATYNNRWSGAFMQSNGRNVFPTVGWVTPSSYDVCFAGLRDGGVFIISTLGVNNLLCKKDYLSGYYEMRCRFPLTSIICVGDPVSGMDSDICYVNYEDSFGSWNKHQNWWQPKLINWDMSIPKGV